ncbi:MAG: hypothetical protein MRY83_14450, partial [Flavobacteriales bacterium]|nr:hypothetical protein [Flavobacteriales bacterium]
EVSLEKHKQFVYTVKLTVHDSGSIKKKVAYYDWIFAKNKKLIWDSPGTGRKYTSNDHLNMQWRKFPKHDSSFSFSYVIRSNEELPDSVFNKGILYWRMKAEPRNSDSSDNQCESATLIGMNRLSTVKLIPIEQ